ncbi:MAG: NosD domain-containing protein, partial [Candidatus Heimdallarchaeota archaeon]
IYIIGSNNNALTDNVANSNEENGIHLLSSNGNTIILNTANYNKNGTFLDGSNNNKIINNILIENIVCYNETGSVGNIFEGNICTSPGVLTIDLALVSMVLLVFVIIESVVIGAGVAWYFLKIRKPKG